MKRLLTIILIAAMTMACQSSPEQNEAPNEPEEAEEIPEGLSVATFAGGCFWCMQPPFDGLDGVEATMVGYTGGDETDPTYQEVSSGQTSHVEAIQIHYDPDEISYEELLHVFWRSMDPTDDGGQFADRGAHYKGFIFAHDDEQRAAAEASRQELDQTGPFDEPIVTEIVDADTFWKAEEYHQAYYRKNENAYKRYYVGSGRAGFLEETWGESR